MAERSEDERKEIRKDLGAVNLSPGELKDWLATEVSQSVDDTGGDGESTGHKSGRRIVELRRKKVDELTGTTTIG